jgi:hypothetical protein
MSQTKITVKVQEFAKETESSYKKCGKIYKSTTESGSPTVYAMCNKDQNESEYKRGVFSAMLLWRDDEVADTGYTSDTFNAVSFELFEGTISLTQTK